MLNNIRQQFSGWLGNTTNRYLMLILLLACINFSIAFTWGLPQVTSPEAASPWPVDTIAPVPPLYHFAR